MLRRLVQPTERSICLIASARSYRVDPNQTSIRCKTRLSPRCLFADYRCFGRAVDCCFEDVGIIGAMKFEYRLMMTLAAYLVRYQTCHLRATATQPICCFSLSEARTI